MAPPPVHPARQVPGDEDVLQGGELGEEEVVLEDEAQKGKPPPGEARLGDPPDRLPLPVDLPLLEGEEARHQVEEGGLAAPRRPEKGEGLPRAQGEGEAAEKEAVAVAVAEASSLEDRAHPLIL